ncbi:uncharacterized protein [Pseudorasbora parva]|uniref:uncharacterized protein n=1 Tax=Pseudorasbora parva TaxID=51549 RepID=UPI00351E4983
MQTLSGSPFADIIQSLAGLHQEHHQALIAVRKDQEQLFRALISAQKEDRKLFRSCLDQGVRTEGTSAAATPLTQVPLTKMGAQDDPEAFLDLFERTAETCGWPQDHCPVRLIPLLTGEAQLAAQKLPVENLLVYKDLKRAIGPEAEDQMVACHGVGEPLPAVSLSSSFSSPSPPSSSLARPVPFPRSRRGMPPRPMPRWSSGEAFAGPGTSSRGEGPFGAGLGTSNVPPLSPCQSLDPLPATRAAEKSGPACWRCGDPGHFIDRCPVMEVGTLVRVPDAPQAAPNQAGLYQIP